MYTVRTFLSVEAVASKPGTAGHMLRAQVGLSCAARRQRGNEPPPARASNIATKPSSVEIRNWVGSWGTQVRDSTSEPVPHLSGVTSGVRTSACDRT